jgi:hypothetical protein
MSGFFDSPIKAVALFLGGAAMLLVWLLNAAFTFTYGADVIGPFLLANQLGSDGSALLSGFVSLLFYDISYTVGFLVLLYACHSVAQYAITGIQFAVCFILSVLASVTSILLLSPLGNDVPETLLLVARYLGYGGLIVGFVVNALATIFYISFNPAMSQKIRESVSAAGLQADQDRFNDQLLKQTRELAYSKVLERIPELAKTQADGITANYLAGLGIGPETKKPEPEVQPVPIAGPNGSGPNQ